MDDLETLEDILVALAERVLTWQAAAEFHDDAKSREFIRQGHQHMEDHLRKAEESLNSIRHRLGCQVPPQPFTHLVTAASACEAMIGIAVRVLAAPRVFYDKETRTHREWDYVRRTIAKSLDGYDYEIMVAWIATEIRHAREQRSLKKLGEEKTIVLSPKQLQAIYEINRDTVRTRLRNGAIPAEKITTKSYRVAVDALPQDWRARKDKATGRSE
jgi:hypothetical protein